MTSEDIKEMKNFRNLKVHRITSPTQKKKNKSCVVHATSTSCRPEFRSLPSNNELVIDPKNSTLGLPCTEHEQENCLPRISKAVEYRGRPLHHRTTAFDGHLAFPFLFAIGHIFARWSFRRSINVYLSCTLGLARGIREKAWVDQAGK